MSLSAQQPGGQITLFLSACILLFQSGEQDYVVVTKPLKISVASKQSFMSHTLHMCLLESGWGAVFGAGTQGSRLVEQSLS